MQYLFLEHLLYKTVITAMIIAIIVLFVIIPAFITRSSKGCNMPPRRKGR